MFAEEMDNAIYSVSHLLDEQPKQMEYMVHSHNYSEILLFLSGDADYFVDGMQYSLKPYDLILIPRHTTHCLMLNSPMPYENYVIHFYESLLFLKHKEKLFQPPEIFNVKGESELLAMFAALDRYHGRYDKEDFDCIAQSLCQSIATYCCYMDRVPAVSVGACRPLIPNLLHYIDSHLTESLSADQLAKQFKISRSYLQNMFSSEMKVGLRQYVTTRKIKAAHSDMADGLSAGEAALKYGFEEYSTFYRLYKKICGASPSSVRKTTANQRD